MCAAERLARQRRRLGLLLIVLAAGALLALRFDLSERHRVLTVFAGLLGLGLVSMGRLLWLARRNDAQTTTLLADVRARPL
jgi:hypothetical protein